MFADALTRLITQFEKLPGIGPKSAQRLAFHILKLPYDEVRSFSDSLLEAKQNLKLCNICCNVTQQEKCPICSDTKRDQQMVCVVAEAKDIAAIERSQGFKGTYHVLHGLLDPMSGVGPEDLKIKELLVRLQGPIDEVIVATNPTIEGDTTALYLAKLLGPFPLKVTRPAHGIPVGGELDYADSATLHSALEYRREM